MRKTVIVRPKTPTIFLAANSLAGTLFTDVSRMCLLGNPGDKYQRTPVAAYV
jgi:hypothetical protein